MKALLKHRSFAPLRLGQRRRQFRTAVERVSSLAGLGLMGSSNRGSLCKALLSGPGRTCAGFRVVFAVGTRPLHDGSSRGGDLPRWTTHFAASAVHTIK